MTILDLQKKTNPYSTAMNGAQQVAVDQAWLMQNIGALSGWASDFDHTAYNSYTKMVDLNAGYDNCATINKLTWVPGSFDFMKLTPDKLSLLQPMIRLYKVQYDEDGEPTSEVEMVFPSTTGTIVGADGALKNILEDSTDTGIGIKSFEYKFIGSTPATVRNDIEAKLVLYFQNFSELLRTRHGKAINAAGEASDIQYRFVDFFDRAGRQKAGAQDGTQSSGALATPRIDYADTEEALDYKSDIQDCADQQAPNRRRYRGPPDFEIKAVLGWASQDGNSSKMLDSATLALLDNTQMGLFLTLVDHDFQFEDDGTFTLELNYRARLGGILGHPEADVLALGSNEGDSGGYVSIHPDDGRRTNWWAEWKSNSGTDLIFEGTPYEILQQLKADLKVAETCCDTEFKTHLQQMYGRLVDEIRTFKFQAFGNWAASSNNPRVEHLTVSRDALDRYARGTNTREGDPEQSWRFGYSEQRPYGLGAPKPGSGGAMDTALSNDNTGLWSGEDMEQEGADARREQWADFVEEGPNHERDWAVYSEITIPFVRLGHIIEYFANVALPDEGTASLSPDITQKIQILLGTIRVNTWNEGALGATGGAQMNLGMRTYFLSDIPIAWMSFRNFWNKRVIQTRRKNYPLLQFMRDLVSDVIMSAINSDYYWHGGGPVSKSQLRTAYLSLPPRDDGANPVDWWRVNNSPGNRYLIDTSVLQGAFNGEKFTVTPMAFLSSKTPAYEQFHYLVITVEDGSMGAFRKDRIPAEMTRRQWNQIMNIHHFGFGEDRGVLKTAKFSKTTQPFLREARYLEDGYNPFQQLSNVYDVELDLVGAPFFYPGQYIWISPYGLSKSSEYPLGSPDEAPPTDNPVGGSYANLMGLGGYHIIIDVGGYLEDGQYEMKINARYDNSGANSGEREGFGSQDTNRCEDEES